MTAAETRRLLWDRAGGLCGICKAPVPFEVAQIDHIIPRCKGGPDALGNLQVAHKPCNERKGFQMDGYVSTREAAVQLGWTVSRVGSHVSCGKIKSLRSVTSGQGSILIPNSEIARLLRGEE